MAIRDGSISLAPRDLPPRHLGCGRVSSSSTNDTSAARLCTNFSQNPGRSSTWQAAQSVTRPSGKVVARFS